MYEDDLKRLITFQVIRLEKLERLNHLIIDFLDLNCDFLMWLKDYCDKNNIPLWREKRFENLIETSQKILKEIDNISTILNLFEPRKLPPRKFNGQNSEDLPEPVTLKAPLTGSP